MPIIMFNHKEKHSGCFIKVTNFNKELCSTKPPSTTEEKKVLPCIPKGRGIFLRLKLFGNVLGVLWASLVAQLIKNPSAVWETWVRSLCWKVPLETGKATHSSIPAWRIPWTIQSQMGHPVVVANFLILGISPFSLRMVLSNLKRFICKHLWYYRFLK